MTLLPLVGVALRASLLFVVTFSCLLPLRRGSSAVRRCIVLLGFSASLAVPLIALPFPGRPLVHLVAPARARVVAEALSTESVPLAPPAPRSARSGGSASRLSGSDWVLVAWAAGALWVLGRALRGVVLARGLVARARKEAAGVRTSVDIDAPVVAGLFRPVVLLPSGAADWTAERRHAVLLHERAHVRHRDGLALLVGQVACAAYWFQPLAWLALRRLRRECELAADDDVIAAGMRPSTYADHLLAIARGAAVPAGGIAMAARPSELARRIDALLRRDRLPAPLTRRRAAALVAATLVVLGFVACTDAAHSGAAATTPVAAAKTRDARVQAITDDESNRVREESGARRVAIVVLDPRSGAVLALSDDAPGAPVVPASTLKPLTVALALDGGLITPEQRFDCGDGERAYGAQVLRDAGRYGSLSTAEILAVSSNIGVSRIFDALGGQRLEEGLRRFRVDAPAGLACGSLQGAIVAMGEGTTTTPVALTSAYAVFANDGVYPGGTGRVVAESTARAVRSMLEGVVTSERATGKAARVAGVRVGGKTGTSDDPDCEMCAHTPGAFASFVGIVPVDRPRWVIYVGVGAATVKGTGGTLAAPVFARIASRMLSLGS
jgi:cell division protein FtsI (penicillin-binding protein 3)